MSDKDIVKMLRMIQGTSLPIRVWQHHMLSAASEIEQNRIDLEEYRRDVAKLTEERDRLKAEVERLRGEQRLKSLIGPSENAVERIIAERDRLKAALEAKQTDPASAVCVWTRTPYTALYSATCCDENYLHKVTASGMCHRCDKPIKFTEAKE